MSVTEHAHAELNRHLTAIGDARRLLGSTMHPLLDRALGPSARPDSHRTLASGGTRDHNTPGPPPETDDPTTWAGPSTGDPTGEAVIARTPPDTVVAQTRRLLDHLAAIAREITELADQAVNTADPNGQRKHLGTPDAIWCTSCLRTGHCEPRRKGYRHCRWCDDFRRVWKTDPPLAILEQHQQGRRLYDRDIRDALDAERKAS